MYSSFSFSVSIYCSDATPVLLFTIYASFPKLLASLYMPKLEPRLSMSGFTCPITITFSVSSIIRGEANENVETELVALFEKVTNEEDLDQTISSLVALWQIAKQDTYNEYTDYAPYIGWYLAIAYLEDYDKDKAWDVLKEMEEMYPVGTAMNDKIKILMEKI